ncbi:hypothetical protein AVL59_10465 [Streptomyces griseochromogenes]|uniref:Uncharacterized protein n=1 Tax=Streptomyces griseochromogenes TaxID=68214 RepID=A0A1B1ATT3_9ACTN|nr:hypothetical protein AVL59_10465 [Streptomyces griseochromogenes]
MGVGVGGGVGVAASPPGSLPGESLGVGVAECVVALSPDGVAPLAGRSEGDQEGVVSPGFDGDGPRPVTASPTVVPPPPLKLPPDTSSYAVMPAMVTPKTREAARTGRFQLFTRAR